MTTVVSVTNISIYFDRLVDLIPSKHYFHAGEAVNLKYLKRAERDTTKAAYKESYKTNKRARLDPDAEQSTAALQKQRNDGDGDVEPQAIPGPPTPLQANLASSASRAELQKRLQAKVSKLRADRKADEQMKSAESAKEWRAKQLAEKGKQKKQNNKKSKAGDSSSGQAASGGASISGETEPTAIAAPMEVDTSDLKFNNIKVVDGPKSSRRDGPKAQTKQQMLKAAEEQAAATQELGGTAEGKAHLKDQVWDKMSKMAKGERILDNPQLLKKSIKRETKHKAKKAELWKGRVNDQKGKMATKQKKRTANLQKRIDEKKDKKIKKRENKLMRAGFEGRKATLL